MSRLNVPDEWDRAELTGRMYEAIDLETAIRDGRFASLNELADCLADQSKLMNPALRCHIWVMHADKPGCLDLNRTIARTRPRQRSPI
ncbi:hypothetical protein [Salinisphaera orenii]|uniref:hypothetical protein n=1 Tax=Salinisphaera orenii TaxID=856731 RepID=UPI0013A63919